MSTIRFKTLTTSLPNVISVFKFKIVDFASNAIDIVADSVPDINAKLDSGSTWKSPSWMDAATYKEGTKFRIEFSTSALLNLRDSVHILLGFVDQAGQVHNIFLSSRIGDLSISDRSDVIAMNLNWDWCPADTRVLTLANQVDFSGLSLNSVDRNLWTTTVAYLEGRDFMNMGLPTGKNGVFYDKHGHINLLRSMGARPTQGNLVVNPMPRPDERYKPEGATSSFAFFSTRGAWNLYNELKGLIDGLSSRLDSITTNLRTTLTQMINDATRSLTERIQRLESTVSSNYSSLVNQINSAKTELRNDYIQRIGNALSDAKNHAQALVSGLRNDLVTHVTNNINNINSRIATEVTNLGNRITNLRTELRDKITQDINSVRDSLNELKNKYNLDLNNIAAIELSMKSNSGTKWDMANAGEGGYNERTLYDQLMAGQVNGNSGNKIYSLAEFWRYLKRHISPSLNTPIPQNENHIYTNKVPLNTAQINKLKGISRLGISDELSVLNLNGMYPGGRWWGSNGSNIVGVRLVIGNSSEGPINNTRIPLLGNNRGVSSFYTPSIASAGAMLNSYIQLTSGSSIIAQDSSSKVYLVTFNISWNRHGEVYLAISSKKSPDTGDINYESIYIESINDAYLLIERMHSNV